MSDADQRGYTLAYQEARHQLDDQERSVAEIRTRAVALGAAAAVTTSFFGSQSLKRGAVGLAAWLAIGCFVFLSLVVVIILWPRRDWSFSIAPATLIDTYIEPSDGTPVKLGSMERDMALHMGHAAALNRVQLRRSISALRVGSLLFVAQSLAWVTTLLING
jgi:hypothetical protein